MATNKILVLGAGELGTAVLSPLAKLAPPGTSISVLLRPNTISSSNPAKIAELSNLKSLGISFPAGDTATQTIPELVSLFSPYDLIISCLGFASGPGSQIKIARAVLEAKVKRFVPWQFGVDYDVVGRGSAQDLFDEQSDVRDLLRNQKGTEWIIVSTGMFTSFLFEAYFGVVDFQSSSGDEMVVRALGDWENKVTVTTPEDIGKLTAMVVFEEPKIKNRVVYTAGETVSYGRVAEIVESVLGKKVKREVWSVEKLKEDLKSDPNDSLKKYRVVFAQGKGVSWDMEKTFNVQRGIEVQDVESFAREKLASLNR
ncbi:putative isoflavone oxidoreductase [Mollisia scopiformis]|uniref:Putative isoflavone oxidoreductase n=1 Tax=Mollisia scopiformis TaxID=149040 RepID=A0A194X7A4_MOLSC|nr:putative isoflavone oxidoreductase [Mollisia scopiformis]KUJ15969.1 putative isoflavone oxidoreductase [Mollisia scopiformis]